MILPSRLSRRLNNRSGAFVVALIAIFAFVFQGGTIAKAQEASGTTFSLQYQPIPGVPSSFDGRVYLVLSKDDKTFSRDPDALGEQPRAQSIYGEGNYFFARNVSDWEPRTSLLFDADVEHMTIALDELPHGNYLVQGVMALTQKSFKPMFQVGNMITPPIRFTHDGSDQTIPVWFDRLVTENITAQARQFEEDRLTRIEHVHSKLLSAFHGRKFHIPVGVALPKDWTEDGKESYPVVVYLSGFSGNEYSIRQMKARLGSLAEEFIFILPNPTFFNGNAVFADSENNGPWGKAMISEVLPYIEKKYRGVGRPYRYVTGVSSGGWGSLWLQVEYPNEFDGVWSIAPDPIDFRAFISNTNIYEPGANLYFDDDGKRKPMGWKGDEVYVWTDDVAQRELFFGNAGQIQSFEAVFSPKAENGRPAPLFDIETGDIDPVVAEAWKKYDIRLKLEREWSEIAPHLRNKLHIWVGEEDNFELHKAVIQLRRSLAARLESLNADIRVIPDMIHHPPPGMFEEVAADALARFKRAKYWCPERGLDTFDPDNPGCIQ